MTAAATGRPRLLVVVPRPPQHDGQGYQRRAYDVARALEDEWDIECVSWVHDGRHPSVLRLVAHPGRLARAVAVAATGPAQVAYFQALAGPALTQLPPHDLALFVTDRTVPRSHAGPFAVDFIDDFGAAALTRARSSGRLGRMFWRWEGHRVQAWDATLAERAVLSVATSRFDASALSARTATVRVSMSYPAVPDDGSNRKVVFAGNLFFAPNAEAAAWICSVLVPRLRSLGVDPADVVIAGRRPPRSLARRAVRAGVDLRPDPPDMAPVLAEAALAVVPVAFGAGTQRKVLDATSVGRPCVLTPFPNRPFGLVDGVSALVRERDGDRFAEAVVELLGDPSRRAALAAGARQQLAEYAEESVHEAWRELFRTVRVAVEGGGGAPRTVPQSSPRTKR